MNDDRTTAATAPETLEGWYALHQIFAIDRKAVESRGGLGGRYGRRSGETTAGADSEQHSGNGGWSASIELIGSCADLMMIHFRTTLDEIGQAQRAIARHRSAALLKPVYSFLSVTEAGLYHLSAELARAAAERGGAVGDEIYRSDVARRSAVERENPHVERRLRPPLPEGMPYVCFYPMSKRRGNGQNWYSLSLEERSRLMHAHGTTGRRYAGRVVQVITGAIGLDAWEWGVTLFAKDPLDFKKLVTDMRFDEVSAKYAEFGDFYVGRLTPASDLDRVIETIVAGWP